MKMIPLGNMASVELSNIDKKCKEGEQDVIMCNFVDVYHNWQITQDMADTFLSATASDSQIAKFTLKKGQVAITKDSETRDDIGMATYIADDIPNAVLGYHCALITPNDDNELSGEYLNLILQSPYALKYFGQNASGSGMRYTLTKEIIEGFPVPMVDIEIQKKSSRILTQIDMKIKLNNSICADLEAMAKQIYDYWFIQFDFPNENGRPYKSSGGAMEYNEELKREIPAGWSGKPLSFSITSINTGLNPRDNFKLNTGGDIKYLTVKNLTTNGVIDFSGCDTIDEDARTIVHRRSDVKKGDILFASIAPLGRCAIVMNNPDDWDINESVFSIRPNNNISSNYLYMFFMSDSFIKKAEHGSVGSIFKGIRITEIQETLHLVPKKEIIDRFDEEVTPLFKQKHLLIQENQELAELRDFLLPMLMNGQIKI